MGSTGEGLYFDAHQRETVEAAMARIIPSDDGPGPREAGVVDFVDRYLSGLSYIYAKPDGSGFQELRGRAAGAWQQRVDRLRQQYAAGLEDLDRRSRDRFGSAFRELDPAGQDAVLSDLEAAGGAAPSGEDAATGGYGQPEPGLQEPATETGLDFFGLLVLHARQGFYSDPVYGGNRGHVGWKHLGFPGPESMAEVHAGRYTTLPYFAETAAEGQETRDGR